MNDPEMVALLKKHFVPFALSNCGNANVTPAEWAWVHQKDRGGNACTIGTAVFTAGGQRLAMKSGGGVKMLKAALKEYKPEANVQIEDPDGPAEKIPGLPAKVPQPPKDGLVLFVTYKVLGGFPDKPWPEMAANSGAVLYYKVWRRMLGVDRVWGGKDEAAALARGDFPEMTKKRLARQVSYFMGSPVKSVDLTLRDQRLSGSFLLENGERCDLRGFVAAKDGKLNRFELIVKGMACGKYGDSLGAGALTAVPPKKKVPVGLAFMLADPKDELSKVMPLAARDLGPRRR